MMIEPEDREIWSDEGAVCPYCGKLNNPADNTSLYNDYLEKFNCEYCNKTFKVYTHTKWTWLTEK